MVNIHFSFGTPLRRYIGISITRMTIDSCLGLQVRWGLYVFCLQINVELILYDKAISDTYLVVSPYCTLHSHMMVNINTIFISRWKYDELLMKERHIQWVLYHCLKFMLVLLALNNLVVTKPRGVECKVKTKWQIKMEYISQKGMNHLREMIAMTTLKFVKGVVVRNIVPMVTNLSSIGLNHTTNSLSEKANEFNGIRLKFNFKGTTRNILVL
jgi:hypothetical protein